MHALSNPQTWIALLTLTALEIVLGIDNIVFISVLSSKLPPKDEDRARALGLGAAMVTRIALLCSLAWVIGLTAPLFRLLGQEISGRDLTFPGGDAQPAPARPRGRAGAPAPAVRAGEGPGTRRGSPAPGLLGTAGASQWTTPLSRGRMSARASVAGRGEAPRGPVRRLD